MECRGNANRATVPIENHASGRPALFATLQPILSPQTSMARVLEWLLGQTPPRPPEDLLAQDEFSYDLLVPWTEGCYLSYATS